MSTRMFGARIERNIDPKLLRGEGAFVDDIPLAGRTPCGLLREASMRAPASGRSMSPRRGSIPGWSRYTPGRHRRPRHPMPLLIPHPSMRQPEDPAAAGARRGPLRRPDHRHGGRGRPLCRRRCRRIDLDRVFEPLPVEIDLEQAVRRRCAACPRGCAEQHCRAFRPGLRRNPEEAFAMPSTSRGCHGAGRPLNGRPDGVPRGCGAFGMRCSGELTVWDGTQAPISVRGGLASISSSTRTRCG